MRKVVLLAVVAAGAGICARQPVRARHGMVAARESHATDIGVAVLESGGNAIDAAVAVGFALAVTHPAAGNIGGGGFLLARFADGRTVFLDFRERAPEKASRDRYIGADGKVTSDSVLGYRASGPTSVNLRRGLRLRVPEQTKRWTFGTTSGTNSSRWPRIFPKTSTTSSCRKTSARLHKIFYTSPEATTT